jgi:hypothetical protein
VQGGEDQAARDGDSGVGDLRNRDHRDGGGNNAITQFGKPVSLINFSIIKKAPPAPRRGVVGLGWLGGGALIP